MRQFLVALPIILAGWSAHGKAGTLPACNEQATHEIVAEFKTDGLAAAETLFDEYLAQEDCWYKAVPTLVSLSVYVVAQSNSGAVGVSPFGGQLSPPQYYIVFFPQGRLL